ncbi:MAG: glycoside hydrolase family 19 protein [Rhizobium sp.]|nr:MAG: glycoside hydrolase family 19 protein [Rhizobium sp.]
MDVLAVQKKLAVAGFSPGKLDGDLGPKTFTAILNHTAKRDLGSTGVLLGRAFAADFPKYNIVTSLRISHFLAQATHETGSFRYLSEMGSGRDLNKDGFDDYLQRYDYRKDLGNNAVGMGPKYRGRGIFQLTGYFNYVAYGRRIGVDLAKLPEKAADPEIATLTACLYWTDRKMNDLADRDDVVGITKKINGGTNGLDDRRGHLANLKALLV